MGIFSKRLTVAGQTHVVSLCLDGHRCPRERKRKTFAQILLYGLERKMFRQTETREKAVEP